MIQWNLWVQAGVVYSAKGTLKELVYCPKPPFEANFDIEMVQRVKLERGVTTRRFEMKHTQGLLVIPTGSKLLAVGGRQFQEDVEDAKEGTWRLCIQPYVGPPEIPLFAVVELVAYDGERFFTEQAKRNWVVVEPQTFFHTTNAAWQRYTLPLRLAWATSPWKLQGDTLDRLIATLDSGRSAAILYTILTRVEHPWHILFHPKLPHIAEILSTRNDPDFLDRLRFQWDARIAAARTRRLRHDKDNWTHKDNHRQAGRDLEPFQS